MSNFAFLPRHPRWDELMAVLAQVRAAALAA